MKPVILFDLDGTLIDSTEAILEGFHHTFDLYKRKHPSDDEIKALIGYPLDAMYDKLGVSKEHIAAYVDTYKVHYRKISCQKTLLLPFAKETIALASSFARIGIVTTKTAKYSIELLEYFGVMDRFEVLIGREDVTHPKPNAEPVFKALEQMDVPKGDIWLIGDTNLDINCAKNAKIKHIAVTSGYESFESLQKYTNNVVDTALAAVKKIKEYR